MSESMKLKYTPEQFQKLLNQFQSAVDSGEYTEKIPYETWRKLKKLYHCSGSRNWLLIKGFPFSSTMHLGPSELITVIFI